MEMGMQNFRKMEFTPPPSLQLGTWEYMTHLGQLAHTDSQLKKCEEIKGFVNKWKDTVNKWKDTGYLMHIAIFIDILSLMCLLRFSVQHDKHCSVKVTRDWN